MSFSQELILQNAPERIADRRSAAGAHTLTSCASRSSPISFMWYRASGTKAYLGAFVNLRRPSRALDVCAARSTCLLYTSPSPRDRSLS
eukprot:4084847-Pyramimonas_sp.AAC.1